MISSRQEEVVGIEKFESDQRENGLDTERASIDEIPVEKERIRLAGHSAQFEYIAEVVELSVNVSANCEFLISFDLDFDHVRLFLHIGIEVEHHGEGISNMELLLGFESVNEFSHEIDCDRSVEPRPVVALFDH